MGYSMQTNVLILFDIARMDLLKNTLMTFYLLLLISTTTCNKCCDRDHTFLRRCNTNL